MNSLQDNPFGKHIGRELEYLREVLDSEDRTSRSRPFVSRLEKEFSERFGVKYAIAHNSGTSTLHTCLAAVGVGAGDEVISPAQTVIMCAFATLHQNAVPVFVDVNPDTFNMDPADIERKITPRTKAIIAVHMHGLPADMPAIMNIARKHNLAVIEDCAQCVLGSIGGQLVGTFGDAASFSFETKKHLSAGEGGMVITNNEELATKIRKIGGLGYKTLAADQALRAILPEEFQSPTYKRHDMLGWNYRMNELTAAVALAQLERVDQLVGRRIRVAELFLEALEGCNWIEPQQTPFGYVNSWWTFTVRYLGEEEKGVSWQEFWKRYKELGGDGFYGGLSLTYQEPVMQQRPFLERYLPIGPCKGIRRAFDISSVYCPQAENLQPKMMQFKTNYRDLDKAAHQAGILRDLWESID